MFIILGVALSAILLTIVISIIVIKYLVRSILSSAEVKAQKIAEEAENKAKIVEERNKLERERERLGYQVQLQELEGRLLQKEREIRTEDRSQRAEDRGQRTEDRGQQSSVISQQPAEETKDYGLWTMDYGLKEDRGQRAEDRGQRAEDRGQRAEDYLGYWGLKEKPFENTLDSRFLYLSSQHEEALMRLSYAIEEKKGAAMLTGVFGCGKTLLAYALLKELGSNYKVAFITNPLLDPIEFLMAIAHELGITNLPAKKTEIPANLILDSIGEVLQNNLRDGRNTVVIIDEAHIIEKSQVFEQIRLLLNFQLEDRFLLTLLLLGQPELKKKVENIKPLEQRIFLKSYLGSLSLEDTRKYIGRRLNVANQPNLLFDDKSVGLIYESSGGIPRRINHICDLSLFIGFDKKVDIINEEIVKGVISVLE